MEKRLRGSGGLTHIPPGTEERQPLLGVLPPRPELGITLSISQDEPASVTLPSQAVGVSSADGWSSQEPCNLPTSGLVGTCPQTLPGLPELGVGRAPREEL